MVTENHVYESKIHKNHSVHSYLQTMLSFVTLHIMRSIGHFDHTYNDQSPGPFTLQ
jgi:hypothetical protein